MRCVCAATAVNHYLSIPAVLFAFCHPHSEGAIVSSNVCLSVCLSVNTLTPELLEVSENFQGIILWSKGRTSDEFENGCITVHKWCENASDILLLNDLQFWFWLTYFEQKISQREK